MLLTKQTYLAMFRSAGLTSFPVPTSTDREVAFVAPYRDDARSGKMPYRAFWTDKVTDAGERLFNVGFDQGRGVEPPPFGMGEPNYDGLQFRPRDANAKFLDDSDVQSVAAAEASLSTKTPIERDIDALEADPSFAHIDDPAGWERIRTAALATSAPRGTYSPEHAPAALREIRAALESLGFGTDEPINGGDCVEAIALLYQRVFISSEARSNTPSPPADALSRTAPISEEGLHRFRILYIEGAIGDPAIATGRLVYECDAEEVLHAIEQFQDEPTNRDARILAVDLADGSLAAGPLLRNADGSYELVPVEGAGLTTAWIRNGDVALCVWPTIDAVVVDVHAAGQEGDEPFNRLSVDRKDLGLHAQSSGSPGP